MRMILQRVSEARVSVDGATVGEIGPGLLILLGIGGEDTPEIVEWAARKAAELRIFEDDERKMNRSLLDIGGEALVVSQFTLYGDTRKGRRPSFVGAAAPEIAEPLCDEFAGHLKSLGIRVATGKFGAKMSVSLINEGPVTLIVER